MVSLEAIFLALFVLSSQNRLATQADKRAHLDLQIDLLAEREMTAVLQIVQDIATQLGVKYAAGSPRIEELSQETDVHELASKLDDELPAGGVAAVIRAVFRPPVSYCDAGTAAGRRGMICAK